jgi:hypothetical protein
MGETAGVDGQGGVTVGAPHRLSKDELIATFILHGLSPYMYYGMLRVLNRISGSFYGLAWTLRFEAPYLIEGHPLNPAAYKPIDWDDIPDKAWDNVTAQLLANLFNLLGERNVTD